MNTDNDEKARLTTLLQLDSLGADIIGLQEPHNPKLLEADLEKQEEEIDGVSTQCRPRSK